MVNLKIIICNTIWFPYREISTIISSTSKKFLHYNLRPNFFLQRPNVFGWSGQRVLAWPGTGTVWQQCVSNTSEAQSINFFHYFTIESDEWFSSFSLSELLAERRAFERRAKSEIQKLNAWALAIQGKKLSGERIANLEKMSECPALHVGIFNTA